MNKSVLSNLALGRKFKFFVFHFYYFDEYRHHGDQVNLSHIVYPHIEMARSLDNYRVQGVFFRDYYPNGEWDIIRAPAIRNHKKYSCCLQPYYGHNLFSCS